MSIAYLDPGNVESDLQAGAAAEYKVRLSAEYDVELITTDAWLRLLGIQGSAL